MSGLLATSMPSPPVGVVWLGPVPLRAYGILMVTAIAVAAWVTWVRYRERGGSGDAALDATLWAVPMGLVGARLYHVVTHFSEYFGPNATENVFRVWEGGMAIFGAVTFGALGAVIGLRRAGQRVGPFADSVAPALLVAQAIGRLGNYFNQELFGGPTELPWGLEIKDQNLVAWGLEPGTLVQPLFLYEALWNLAMAVLLVVLDKRIKFKSGQVMSLYLVVYGVGRIIMETMRLDTPGRVLGLRVNMFTAILFVLAGLICFYVCGRVGASTRVSPAEVERYNEIVAAREARRGRGRQSDSLQSTVRTDTGESEVPRYGSQDGAGTVGSSQEQV